MLKSLARIFASKEGVGRNMFFMVVSQAANYLAPLLTFPHLARVLRPEGFGVYGIFMLVGGWMTIVSDWGTNYSGARIIAQTRALTGNIDEVFWNIFFLRIAIALALLAGVVAYMLLVDREPGRYLLFLAAWSIILGNALTVSWCLQGLERLDAFATASLIGRLFTVPATILLVSRPDQAWLAVLILGAGGCVIGLTSLYILYRSRAIKKFHFSPSGSFAHLIEGAPILVSTASHGLYSSTATILLGYLGGAHMTGLFVAADRIRIAAQGAVQPIGQALYPRISRLAVTDKLAAIRTIRLLAFWQTLLIFSGCVILFVFAPLIIRIIAGRGYEGSIGILQILAFTVLAFATNAILGWQTLLPFGFTKQFGRVNLVAAIFNVVACSVLIYNFGAYGAAFGVLATECCMTLQYIVIILRNRILAASPDGGNVGRTEDHPLPQKLSET